MTETVTPATPASEESRTWAHTVMAGVRRVQALHAAVPRWVLPGDDEASFVEYEDAVEALDGADPETISSFLICQECGRIEAPVASELGYEAALWPCQTALALGIEEGPLL